ncbi:MAG: hypothetical protein AAF579_10250 [Cyanobacteria bacterium P01_C01_bin.118]
MAQTLKSGTLYVQDYTANRPSKLYTLDLETGKAKLVGKLTTEVYDLVFVDKFLYGLDRKSSLFGKKTMELIKIDPATGQLDVVGDTMFDVVGIDYNPANKKIYGTAHRSHQIIEIDAASGAGRSLVTLSSDRNHPCGEIAFDSSGNAFITILSTDLKKSLATCDLATGKVTMIGDIGFPGLASMKFIGDSLYGVAGQYEGVGGSNGQIIRIDTTTGQGTLVTTTDPLGCWAGMAVYASASSTSPSGPSISSKPGIQPPEKQPAAKVPANQPPSYPKPPVSKPPKDNTPKVPVVINNWDQLTFDQFGRNPATDIICVAPVRTMIHREEEIVLIRRVRKVEEIDASPTCPTGTTSVD